MTDVVLIISPIKAAPKESRMSAKGETTGKGEADMSTEVKPGFSREI